jgi:methyl-accepting chemotaxis protein
MSLAAGFGITRKLLVTLMLVSLLPMAAIWFISYQNSIALTEEKVEQQLNASNNVLITKVNDWVDMNQRMLLQNAELREMSSMQAEQQNPILQSMSKHYEWAYLAFSVDVDGKNVGRSDGKKVTYYGDRDYFKQVIAGERFGKQVLIGKTSGKPALILSTAINDNSGKLNGVLALAMTLTEISDEIVTAKIGVSGYTFLLDEKGEVIAHPNEEFTRSRVDMSKHQALQALKRGESHIVYTDYDGEKVVAVAGKTLQGWTMISQQNYDEAYKSIQKENIKAAILLMVTILVVLAISLVVSRRLTAPIRELTKVAEQYSEGNLQLQISGLQRNDEIGQLARAIERLGTSIRMAMDRLLKNK